MKIITYKENKEYEIKCSKEELLKLKKLIEGALDLHEKFYEDASSQTPFGNSYHPYTDYFNVEEVNSEIKIGFNVL